jgi:hypothetical protein
VDVRFPMKSSAKDFLEKIPMGINYKSNNRCRKFPIEFNPMNFLHNSFESNTQSFTFYLECD